MNSNNLIELIETGEGYTLEFKEKFTSSIGKEICAFANASGGKILLGVKAYYFLLILNVKYYYV